MRRSDDTSGEGRAFQPFAGAQKESEYQLLGWRLRPQQAVAVQVDDASADHIDRGGEATGSCQASQLCRRPAERGTASAQDPCQLRFVLPVDCLAEQAAQGLLAVTVLLGRGAPIADTVPIQGGARRGVEAELVEEGVDAQHRQRGPIGR